MNLTQTGEYVARQTIYLHNQILNIQYFNLMWDTNLILVSWDSTHSTVLGIFGPWDGDEEDFAKLEEIIFEHTVENGLTEDNQ